jgi:hypothetical protein
MHIKETGYEDVDLTGFFRLQSSSGLALALVHFNLFIQLAPVI